ncbi:MAG: hypothetical protein H0T79_12240 [Deltaproteobacteria bacterium]|nr:hypothetical protein [Deltaproteobacteria bacterium]
MKLAEAEVVGPPEHEGDSEVITPPRPPHRRVSISLIFTLTVLIGTVVAIYKVFPARHNVLLTEAATLHRQPPAWELVAPTPQALHGWVARVVGEDVALPSDTLSPSPKVIGARRIEILDRDAAVFRVELAGEPLTYIVQQSRTISPEHTESDTGGLHAVATRRGSYTIVVVGRGANIKWHPAIP